MKTGRNILTRVIEEIFEYEENMDDDSGCGSNIEFFRVRRGAAVRIGGKSGTAGYFNEVQLLPEGLSGKRVQTDQSDIVQVSSLQ